MIHKYINLSAQLNIMARYTGRLCRECKKNIVLCKSADDAICEDCMKKTGRGLSKIMRGVIR